MNKLSQIEPISFTRKVKEEICTLAFENELAKKAMLSGFMKINSTLSIRNTGWVIQIRTENIKIAKLILSIIKDLYDVEPRISISEQKRFRTTSLGKIVHIDILNKAKLILEDLGIYDISSNFNKLPDFITHDIELIKYYLKGCFLASGSVNSPTTKNYHFEIATQNYTIANFIIKLLKKFYIEGKTIDRRNQVIVYVKKSDSISDLLRIFQTMDSLLYFEDTRIQRDQLNSMNRVLNCEVSNEKKAIENGNYQAEAIRWYKDMFSFDDLDGKLKIVAEVRLASPDASYVELCKDCKDLFNLELSKSGFSYRMSKLMKIIEKLRKL